MIQIGANVWRKKFDRKFHPRCIYVNYVLRILSLVSKVLKYLPCISLPKIYYCLYLDRHDYRTKFTLLSVSWIWFHLSDTMSWHKNWQAFKSIILVLLTKQSNSVLAWASLFSMQPLTKLYFWDCPHNWGILSYSERYHVEINDFFITFKHTNIEWIVHSGWSSIGQTHCRFCHS